MDYLTKFSIICPYPIHVGDIEGKPAALFSFLEGRGVEPQDITPDLCHELGKLLAKMHIAGQTFPMSRVNSMSFNAWESRLIKVGETAKNHLNTFHHIKKNWPSGLPTGAIHADLFPDNVFIKEENNIWHIYGVIDFYFSATDFLAYDLAIVMNAWCFESDHSFNQEKWNALLSGYQTLRPLSQPEKDAYPILCQGAAMRFLSSRLHDFVFHDPKNLVTPKPPSEYIEKLEFLTHAKFF